MRAAKSTIRTKKNPSISTTIDNRNKAKLGSKQAMRKEVSKAVKFW